jgi:GT2 family glycosyltransferase
MEPLVMVGAPFSAALDLTTISRHPTELSPDTVRAVSYGPIPARPPAKESAARPSRDGVPASIIIVTFNGLVFTRLCLESLLANTEDGSYEAIVVDNGSHDRTGQYLRALSQRHPQVRVILNRENVGFGPATNQGLAVARGETLALLNNDTIVPPSWLTRLSHHLAAPDIGLVGAVTGFAGNEARININYRTYGELEEFARARADAHRGETLDIPVAEMFCVALRRDVYERLGPLDERFEIGMFEDDDYSLRARRAGYRVVCAEDTFVHHFGQASFGQLVASGARGRLFQANQRRFEEKWGIPWEHHRSRLTPEYEELIREVRESVRQVIPAEATVVVVSRGDNELLALEGRRAWHFPQTDAGDYAGSYPADSASAMADLERLRARGAEFLVFPRTTFWWLDHYRDLADRLGQSRGQLLRRDGACAIYDLRHAGAA